MAKKTLKEIAAEIAAEKAIAAVINGHAKVNGCRTTTSTGMNGNGHAKASKKTLDAKVAKAIDDTHKQIVAVNKRQGAEMRAAIGDVQTDPKAKQPKLLIPKEPKSPCLCGCGGVPAGKKTHYLPGHDARHAAAVMAIVRSKGITVADLNAFTA